MEMTGDDRQQNDDSKELIVWTPLNSRMNLPQPLHIEGELDPDNRKKIIARRSAQAMARKHDYLVEETPSCETLKAMWK